MAGWVEAYAEFLELKIWTSSTVQRVKWNETKKTWSIEVSRGDGTIRVLRPKHVVFATGFGAGKPYTPEIPGRVCKFETQCIFTSNPLQDRYEGTVLHSVKYRSAKGFEGKKAIVVGACNSGGYTKVFSFFIRLFC